MKKFIAFVLVAAFFASPVFASDSATSTANIESSSESGLLQLVIEFLFGKDVGTKSLTTYIQPGSSKGGL